MQINKVTYMENNRLESLLISLEDEIDKKCFQIKEKKKEETKTRLFLLACFLFLLLPFLLLYLGISLLAFCFPVILFLAVSMIALLPVLFKNMETM